MAAKDTIRLTQYPDKTLIFNAYDLDPTIHKRTLADHVVGCSYEYVRRLFAGLDAGEIDEETVDEHLDDEIQRELARRLLAQGLTLDTDLDIDVAALDIDPIPTAKLDEYVVPAAAVAGVRDALGDTRDLMESMEETAGEAVATMAIEKLDELLREARAE